MGDVYLEQGDTNAALDAYQEAVRLEPNNPLYVMDEERAWYHLDRLRDARPAAEKALCLKPDWAVARDFLGVVLFDMQDFRGALEAQENAFRLSPNNASYACNIGMDYLELGRKKKAVQWFKEARALDPKNQNARRILQGLGG